MLDCATLSSLDSSLNIVKAVTTCGRAPVLTEVTDDRLKLWHQTRSRSTDEITSRAMHGL